MSGVSRWLGSASLLVLAACHPQATRLLLLDEALTQGAELEPTARPWRDAGYEVEYRRYYPHLTRSDLGNYRVVVILGGRRPAAGSDALDVGDLALLTEWTLRGGVAVLGYPPEGGGSFDRWLMNHWLAWSGVSITIGDFALRSAAVPTALPPARAVLTAGLRGTGFDPFPAGTNNVLLVEDQTAVLARVGAGVVVQAPGLAPAGRAGAAVVAANRVGNGLVLVLSRGALAALAQEDSANSTGTRAFLVALARWTRRPAEWARVPTAGPRTALRLEGGPLPVVARAPRLAPPAGVPVERLARRQPLVPQAERAGAPNWMTRAGVRALYADFAAIAPPIDPVARLFTLDSLTRLLDVGAFNVLVTDAHAAALADSAKTPRWQRDALRAAWQQVAGRLQATSVRWIPVVLPRDLVLQTDSTPDQPCPLDAALWGRLASGVRVLARFAASRAELIPAVGLSLDETTVSWGNQPFCEAAWQAGLAALPRDTSLSRARLARLAAVAPAARYDSLLEAGLLAAYDSSVARLVRQRAAGLLADVRRTRRSLLLAVVTDRSPGDWFTRSLVRGASSPDAPLLIFAPNLHARTTFASSDSVNVLSVVRLDPAVVLAGGVTQLNRGVLAGQDGFWLGPAESLLAGPSDSLARIIRRLSKER